MAAHDAVVKARAIIINPFVFFILLSCLKRQGYSKPLRIIVSTRIVDYLKLI